MVQHWYILHDQNSEQILVLYSTIRVEIGQSFLLISEHGTYDV